MLGVWEWGHASVVHLQWCLLSERPVEDTHLHATLQRLLEQVEVRVAHEARKDNPERVPKLDRQGIVDVVREVQSWHHPQKPKLTIFHYLACGFPSSCGLGGMVCVCVGEGRGGHPSPCSRTPHIHRSS